MIAAHAVVLPESIAEPTTTIHFGSPSADPGFERGSNRRFNGSSPTNAWRAVTFDDSSWALGVAPFYYDTDNIYTGNTLLSDMQNRYTSIFMREKFFITNVAAIATLTLRSWCDDGYVVWINGTRITNYNQTSANYAYTNAASANAPEPLQWFGLTLQNSSFSGLSI